MKFLKENRCFILWFALGLIIITGSIVGVVKGTGEATLPPTSRDHRLITLQEGYTLVAPFSTGTTTPGVTKRTYTTFDDDANNIIIEVPPRFLRVKIKVSSTTNNDNTVIDFFTCPSADDSFTRNATLAWTTGTQTAIVSGDEWADTVAVSNVHSLFQPLYSSPATDGDPNYIAEYSVDVAGNRYVGFSPTTITNAAHVYLTGL